MTPLIALILLALATWRVSCMFTRETGPFHIFEKLREASGIIHDPDGNVQTIPGKFFAELLSCVYCSSVWVAGFWVLFYILLPCIAPWVALPFALSTVAIVIERFS